MRDICTKPLPPMQLLQSITTLLLLLSTVSVQGAGYQVQFTAISTGKAAGDVLVLDVSSLWQKYPTQPPISVTSTAECQRRCAALPGCTAYAFCGGTEGCGSGCRDHTQKHPALTLTAAVPDQRGGDSSASPDKQLALPILSFGPFVPNSASGGCNDKDPEKWAFGTCTLITNTTVNQLVVSGTEGSNWSSAWLSSPLPSICSSLSPTACAACHGATTKPEVCLSCMRDKRVDAYSQGAYLIADGAPVGSTGSRTLDQCATCAQLDSSELQKQCMSCVLDSAACSSCIPYPGAATQIKLAAVSGCISCVMSRGKRFTGTCLTCSATSDPVKCSACLSRFYPDKMCKTSTYTDCYKPDFDNPCALCQGGAADAYDSCITCYQQPAAKADCDACSSLADKKEQLQCYACSSKSQAARRDVPGGCGLCFAHSLDAETQRQCIDCVVSGNTPKSNKQHCHLCASTDLTQQQAQQCYKCLSSPTGGPACSTCAQATVSQSSFDSCMTCYKGQDNGPDCDECSAMQAPSAQGSWDETRKQCFVCVAASGLKAPDNAGFAPLGSCAACFTGTGSASDCIACNTAPNTIVAAKTWCGICSGMAGAPKVEACFSCLRTNHLNASSEYIQKCGLPS